jgi:hypothetical protein
MKIREIITESLSHNDAENIIGDFLKFVKNFLELDELPVINLIKDSDYSIKHRSFGGYSPSDKSINVMISNRHIQDLLRTIAHETVHYKQDLNGELHDDSGTDGSQEENEANSTAAIILRKWGKMHPELFGYEPIQ